MSSRVVVRYGTALKMVGLFVAVYLALIVIGFLAALMAKIIGAMCAMGGIEESRVTYVGAEGRLKCGVTRRWVFRVKNDGEAQD